MGVIIDVITALFGVIAASATVVLAFITRRYAHLTRNYVRVTREILKENRQMRLDAQEPEINVDLYSYLEKGRTHVDLYVENLGGGPAYDVDFDVDLSLKLSDRRTLGEVIFLESNIRRLAPGRKKTHRLGPGTNLDLEGLKAKPLEIGVTYKNKAGDERQEDFFLDFREHFGR